jgi:hypothetical protein
VCSGQSSSAPAGLVAGLAVLGVIALAASVAAMVLYQRLQGVQGHTHTAGADEHHLFGVTSAGAGLTGQGAMQQAQQTRV